MKPNQKTDKRNQYKKQLAILKESLAGNNQPIKIKKKTISNLFRYDGRQYSNRRLVDLSKYNNPIYIDVKNSTLEVMGLTTYKDIVDYTLPHGFLPTITPELKHITIGGAMVGIGIESNCYKFGFVHDGLLEADVLLPDGKVVNCTGNNKYSDLFYGLPNSYGSLGYILRAKIRLHKVTPYVTITTRKFTSTKELLDAIEKATKDSTIDYIESLVYSKNNLFLSTTKHTTTPTNLKSIYGRTIFYKEVSKPGTFSLKTRDYIFRYDPEWFWNLPEAWQYTLFRMVAPEKFRNSGFYTRYNQKRDTKAKKQPNQTTEKLIQDWEVPWPQADKLLRYALKTADLEWRPWLITVIKTPALATSYPMKKNTLYLNLGSYSFAKKIPNRPDYESTRLIDAFCFKNNGIKMLYSSTFLTKSSFDKIYNGTNYAKLKTKYDPNGLFPTLYEKTVSAK